VCERQLNALLAVCGLYDGGVSGELPLKDFAQVVALRDVVFGN
jgi:hypothetical protein